MGIRLLFKFLISDDARTKYNQKMNYKPLFGRIGQFQSEFSENFLTFSYSTPTFRISHDMNFLLFFSPTGLFASRLSHLHLYTATCRLDKKSKIVIGVVWRHVFPEERIFSAVMSFNVAWQRSGHNRETDDRSHRNNFTSVSILFSGVLLFLVKFIISFSTILLLFYSISLLISHYLLLLYYSSRNIDFCCNSDLWETYALSIE